MPAALTPIALGLAAWVFELGAVLPYGDRGNGRS
jgi:hypothetical protein